MGAGWNLRCKSDQSQLFNRWAGNGFSRRMLPMLQRSLTGSALRSDSVNRLSKLPDFMSKLHEIPAENKDYR